MTIEVHGHDGACAWSDSCFQLSWIDGECRRIDIDKNWNGAEEETESAVAIKLKVGTKSSPGPTPAA
jgi:hypothetical protein